MQSSLHTVKAVAVLAICAVLGAFGQAHAEQKTHRTVFDVRFGALPIGEATFNIRFGEQGYIIGMRGKTVGVAQLVAPGRGIAASTGLIGKERVVARRHSVRYIEKDKQSKLNMNFKNGAVHEVVLKPDDREKKNGPKWIQLTPAHLKNVIDPASSVIVAVDPQKANDGEAVCNRTMKIYDGDTRFNMVLKYKSTTEISTEGYEGEAFVCQLRYQPVAGHEVDQRNIKYMRENEKMEIWLAPMARPDLFTPIKVVVPTWIGKFTASPRYFGEIPEAE